MPHMQNTRNYRLARNATLVGVFINIFLGIVKILLGIISHSVALTADGIHSFSDLLTDFFVLISSKASSRAPDSEHPYGHRRIDTFFTIVLAVVLFSVALFILYEAIHNIMRADCPSGPHIYSFAVVLISIGSNEWLYHYTLAVANQINSTLLRANAWHRRSDAFSSVVVLVGLGGHALGFCYLDPIAAIVVAILIGKVAYGLVHESVKELIDTSVDKSVLDKISKCVCSVDGVRAVHRLRTRLLGGEIFVDIHIQVDPRISVSEGHYVAIQVERLLKNKIKKVVDVTVHIDPENDEKKMLYLDTSSRTEIMSQLTNKLSGLPTYRLIEKIILHYVDDKIEVEIFLPAAVLKNETVDNLTVEYRRAISGLKNIVLAKLYFS